MVIVWNDVRGARPSRCTACGGSGGRHRSAVLRPVVRARAVQEPRGVCRAVGLRPIAVRVGALGARPTPEPPEPELVSGGLTRALEHRSAVRGPGVWCVRIRRAERVGGRQPRPVHNVASTAATYRRRGQQRLFDSLYYSSAVIGLVTSAFLERRGRGPVLTFELPSIAASGGDAPLRYLRTVAGGLLRSRGDAGNWSNGEAVALEGRRTTATADSSRRSSSWRHGVPATPAFSPPREAAHEGTQVDPTLERHAWLRPVVAGPRGAPGRRQPVAVLDERVMHGTGTGCATAAQQSRIEAKVEHRNFKLRRRAAASGSIS